MTDTETRTSYTKGLRALADLLDAHPDIPLPYSLSGSKGLQWYIHRGIDPVLTIRALMTSPVTEMYDSHQGNFPVQITGTLAGFPTSVLIAKEIALDPREGFIVPRPAMNPRLLAAESVPA